MFSGVNTILFDFDGTLANTNDLIMQSFHFACKQVLDRDFADEVFLPYFGRPLADQFIALGFGKVDELITAYREYNTREHDRLTKPFPGVADMVHTLTARGYRLGVVTSKIRRVTQMGLELVGLDDGSFEAMIAMEDTTKHKPDPEPVLKALEVMGVRADTAAMVGDSPFDIMCGNGAQVKTLAVGWTTFPRTELAAVGPTAFAETPADLLRIFAKPN